ncbi:MAG: hypothetical protein ABI895_18290 [Deltaproteobacteria bacterium]
MALGRALVCRDAHCPAAADGDGRIGDRMTSNLSALYSISFDGLPMSGIVGENVKLARLFALRGYEVHLDLGYDIKPRTKYFGQPYTGMEPLPPWVTLTRLPGLLDVNGYGRDLLLEIIERHIKAPDDATRLRYHQLVGQLSNQIAEHLAEQWRRLRVRNVIVENGTIPENVAYTMGVRQAIEQYGREMGLGRFALWRDHDVMWFYPHDRYGAAPYDTIPRLPSSRHIQHVATNSRAASELSKWSRVPVAIWPFCHSFEPAVITRENGGFRRDFSIPDDAILFARCSRIVPEKRIDRDIHLVCALQQMLASQGLSQRVILFVTSPIDERPEHFAYLRRLARELGIEESIIFGDGLAPFESPFTRGAPAHERHRYGIRDLLAHSQLSCFLTSYRFEGYGLPPGEAIAARIPYASTTYELYDTVYAKHGFKSPTLAISASDDGLAPEGYVRQLLDLLLDGRQLAEAARFNHDLGRDRMSMQHFASRPLAAFPHLDARSEPRSPRPGQGQIAL